MLGTLLCLTPAIANNQITCSFPTESGKTYQPQSAANLNTAFSNDGAAIPGDGTPKSFTRTVSGDTRFYRIEEN
jgi:hypothetical protein